MNAKQSFYRLTRAGFILLVLFVLLPTISAKAADVTLRWDPINPTPGGYRIYLREGSKSYNYSQSAWQGSTSTCTIGNLKDGVDYRFVVRAFDGSLESASSNEVYFVSSNSVPDDTSPDPTTGTGSDATPPTWNGATSGVGLATDNGTGGNVTVEFDTSRDTVDGTNLKFNVYYATSSAWKNTDWSDNNVLADATVKSGGTFAHAVTLSGLTNNVRYTLGVRAEDRSGNEDANTRTLTATPTKRQTNGNYNLMLSRSADRSGDVFLDDAEIQKDIYVFVEPVTGIESVKFFVDNKLKLTENAAPYDLAGTNGNNANPFNADSLSSGYHTFSAQITKTDGSSETISADAYVIAGSAGIQPPVLDPVTSEGSAYTQWVSTAANRSNPDELDGVTVADRIYVFVEPITDIKKVEFFIDGALKQTENLAPYDLAGGGADDKANPYDCVALSNGTHSFSARITKTNGSSETIVANVLVDN